MIADLKPYAEYKESGLLWLGQVPAHWHVRKLKHLAEFVNGLPFKPGDWGSSGVPIIRIQNLNGSNTFNYTRRQDLPAALRIRQGDLLFAWSGNRGTSFGPFIWNRSFDGYLNQHIFKLTRYILSPRYFKFVLRAVTTHIEEEKTHGIIGLVHVTKPELGSAAVPVASASEQTAIVRFLDWANGRLERAIRAKRKVIALLGEQKQAIIHRAVTRGLDPSVPLKPSGIPWLGDIPQHWDVLPLKSVCAVQSGITLGKDYAGQALNEYPYLRVANVQAGHINLAVVRTIRVPRSESLRCLLQKGDVLMTEGGDPDKLGRGCVWDAPIDPCLHQNHIFAVRPIQPRLEPKFLSALMGTSYARSYFESTAKQTTNLASTNKTKIGMFKVLLPPMDEQKSVLVAINTETRPVNAAISRLEREIELLREYRTRLVADVVTGKLDVCEAALHLPEEAPPDTTGEDADLIADPDASDDEASVE